MPTAADLLKNAHELLHQAEKQFAIDLDLAVEKEIAPITKTLKTVIDERDMLKGKWEKVKSLFKD